MGILEHVSGLEDMMSGMEEAEKPKQKTKKAESEKSDSQLNSRLEKIEESIVSFKKAVEDIKNNMQSSSAETQPSSEAMEKLQDDMETLRETVSNLGKKKGGAGEDNLQDILQRLDEIEDRAPSSGKDYSGEIEELRKSVSEIRNSIASGAVKGGEPTRMPEKSLLELKSRMDVLQKYVDGKIGAIDRIIEERLKGIEEKTNSIRNETAKTVSETLRNIPKRDDIRKDIEEKINGKLAEFSKKVDELSKYDLGKLKSVVDAEKNLDEKMKLFALNSDAEKIWKETEGLRRYVDEKSKYADSLGNSLRSWEERNLRLMGKEHELDEKMEAFPELKLIDGRIRKLERALLELQRHFVAAQLSGPIIIE